MKWIKYIKEGRKVVVLHKGAYDGAIFWMDNNTLMGYCDAIGKFEHPKTLEEIGRHLDELEADGYVIGYI